MYYNFRDIQSIESFLVRRMFLNSKNIPKTKDIVALGVTIMP